MGNDRINKRAKVEEWTDSVNDCLKKRALNIVQARRMVYDRNEWQGL